MTQLEERYLRLVVTGNNQKLNDQSEYIVRIPAGRQTTWGDIQSLFSQYDGFPRRDSALAAVVFLSPQVPDETDVTVLVNGNRLNVCIRMGRPFFIRANNELKVATARLCRFNGPKVAAARLCRFNGR